jgi:hypothetical protein
MGSKRALTQAEIAVRRERLIEMRRDGKSWSHIAKALGYADAPSACTDLRRTLEQRQEQLAISLDQHRQMELEKLDRLERAAITVLETKHVHISGGKVVREGGDEETVGEPLYDDGPVLQAIETLRRLSERRAKLLGIDAPTKVETDGQLTVIVEGVDVEDLK